MVDQANWFYRFVLAVEFRTNIFLFCVAHRTSQTLKIHSRMVHQGVVGKIFGCDACDYSSANKQTLKHHINHRHMGVKVCLNRITNDHLI